MFDYGCALESLDPKTKLFARFHIKHLLYIIPNFIMTQTGAEATNIILCRKLARIVFYNALFPHSFVNPQSPYK